MNMQRKISCVIVFSLIISILSLMNVSALNIGDEIGDVLNTDIKTYIDDNRIPSYNINGKAAVIIKDLINYGFDSVYNNATRTTTVTYNSKKAITPLTSFDETKGQVGTVAFKYVYTDIVAIVNGKEVESFNIKGNLAIFFGDLADYGTFAYDNSKRESRFTTQLVLTILKLPVESTSDSWIFYDVVVSEGTNSKNQNLTLSGYFDDWLKNVEFIEGIVTSEDYVININTENGKLKFSVAEGSFINLTLLADGKQYTINFGIGTCLVVRKTSTGAYILLPEETLKISPPR